MLQSENSNQKSQKYFQQSDVNLGPINYLLRDLPVTTELIFQLYCFLIFPNMQGKKITHVQEQCD